MTAMMIESALRALLFAIVVGAGLRLLRVLNVPVRKTAWSVVLITSLAMPLLMRWSAATELSARFAWVVPIRVQQLVDPLVKATLPATPVVLVSSEDTNTDRAPVSTAVSASTTPEAAIAEPAMSIPQRHWPAPGRLIEVIYMTIAAALMLRLLWGLGMALHLWTTAEPVSPLVAPEPHVRWSAKIPSPVTIGSGIVLPANYTEWDRKKLRMVLAHERSHVRQLDFYLQLLAGVYTAVFWFSPLGWWLRRTLCALGEAIGDRAGLDAAPSRSCYAEVLLEFAAMPRQTLPGVAMARTGNLSRRIERLLNEHHFRSAFAEGRQRALVSLLLIPAALFATTALIRVPRAEAQTAPPAPAAAPAPTAVPTPAAAAASDQPAPLGQAPLEQTAPASPAPPAAGTPPEPMPAVAPAGLSDRPAISPLANGEPIAVEGPEGSVLSTDEDQDSHGYAYHFSDSGDSYAIIEGSDDQITFSGDWSGDRKAEIEAARKVAKGPFLWFTHEGKSYVVDDPALVAKIRAMYRPMEDLGRQQADLGRQQEMLGKQQEALARAQEDAGNIKLPDLSKEMAEVDAAMVKAKSEEAIWNSKQMAEVEAKLKADQGKMLTPEKMAEIQAKVAEAQAQLTPERMAKIEEKLAEIEARLGSLQGEAGARQGEFGAKMGALGAKQGELGQKQGRLGEEQGKLAQQADRQVKSIIEQTLRDGKATQVPDVH